MRRAGFFSSQGKKLLKYKIMLGGGGENGVCSLDESYSKFLSFLLMINAHAEQCDIHISHI